MTIPPPPPNLVIETILSLLKDQAASTWMSPDVTQFIESNGLLQVIDYPGWLIKLTPAGGQFIAENQGGDKMPTFKFESTGQFQAIYRALGWGEEWNDRRVAFRSAEPDYQPDGNGGSRFWNYTPEEFKREILDVIGYLHWDGSATSGAPPLEWAEQLNAMFREQHALACKRFPDLAEEEPFQLQGVARYDMGHCRWIKTDLPNE